MLVYLQLLRPKNIIILVATQWILKYFIYDKIFYQHDIDPTFSPFDFAMLTAISATVIGAGNVINDWFDQGTDEINPNKNRKVGVVISQANAGRYYGLLIALGIGPAFYLTLQYFSPVYFVLLPLAHGVLYLYSKYLKGLPLSGNVIVAGLGACACLLVGLAEAPAQEQLREVQPLLAKIQSMVLMGFAGMAFLLHLGREIVKDIEDMPGDRACGLRTTAVQWGLQKSKYIAMGLLTLTAIPLIAWGIFRSSSSSLIEILYYWLVFIPAFILSLILLTKSSTSQEFRKVSSAYKGLMVLGLIYLVLASW